MKNLSRVCAGHTDTHIHNTPQHGKKKKKKKVPLLIFQTGLLIKKTTFQCYILPAGHVSWLTGWLVGPVADSSAL